MMSYVYNMAGFSLTEQFPTSAGMTSSLNKIHQTNTTPNLLDVLQFKLLQRI